MIPRTVNEAANVELARRDPSYVRVPSGEMPGETIVFEHSISHAQWLWPSGVASERPDNWPRPWDGEVPDYVDTEAIG